MEIRPNNDKNRNKNADDISLHEHVAVWIISLLPKSVLVLPILVSMTVGMGYKAAKTKRLGLIVPIEIKCRDGV